MKSRKKIIIVALLMMNLVLMIGNVFAGANQGQAYIYTLGMKDDQGIVWCPHSEAAIKCMAKMPM